MSTTVGTVIIDVKADTAKLVSGMDKANKTVSKSINNIKKAVVGLAAAYAGFQGVRAFKNMIDDSIEAADATGKLAQQFGLTTEQLSKYQYAAGFAAVENGKLNAGLNSLIRRLNNFQQTGGGAGKKGFEALGISAEYARENFKTTDDAFKEILKRLEEMPDGYKKTAAAQDIFSKSSSSILRLTASDLKKFGDEAERIGVAIPQSIYNMAATYNDEMTRLDARFEGIGKTITYSMLPAMTAASQTAVQMYDSMFGDSANQMEVFGEVATDTIMNVISAIGLMQDSWTGVKLVMKTFEAGVLALGHGLIDGFVNAFIAGLNTLKGELNSFIKSYNDSIVDSWLGKKVGADKIELFGSTEYINLYGEELNNVVDEIKDLTTHLTDGRDKAAEFSKIFQDNMEKNAEAAKNVKDIVKDINTEVAKVRDKFSKIPLPKTTVFDDNFFNDATAIADATFQDWADTLNSSISNSLVDALTGGDVMGAVQSLGGSIASSMIQASSANIMAGGAQLKMAGGPASMGGIYGIAAGVGISALTSMLNKKADTTTQDQLKELNKKADERNKFLQAAQSFYDASGSLGSSFAVDFQSSSDKFATTMQKSLIDVEARRINANSGIMEGERLNNVDFGSASNEVNFFIEGIQRTLDGAHRTIDGLQYSVSDLDATVTKTGDSSKEFVLAWEDLNSSGNRALKDLGQAIIDLGTDAYSTATSLKGVFTDYQKMYENLTGKTTFSDASLSSAKNTLISSGAVDSVSIENISKLLYDIGDAASSSSVDLDSLTKSIKTNLDSAIKSNPALQDLDFSKTGAEESIKILREQGFAPLADDIDTLNSVMGKTIGTTDLTLQELLDLNPEIKKVYESLAASKANIKQWEDSFKSPLEKLQESSFGYVTQMSDLNTLYLQLKLSGGELTDAELDHLNANKDYIESINATAEAAKAASEQMSQSAADMYEQLTGTVHSTTQAYDDLSTSFVDGLGGLQSVLDQVASNTLTMTDTQWQMVQAVFGLQDINKSSASNIASTSTNTSRIEYNTRTTSGYDKFMGDYLAKTNAEGTVNYYKDKYGSIGHDDAMGIAGIAEIIQGAMTKYPNYTTENSGYNQELDNLAKAFGLNPNDYYSASYSADSHGGVKTAGEFYKEQLKKMFSDLTGMNGGDIGSIQNYANALDILTNATDAASTSLSDLSTSTLGDVVNSFDSIINTTQSYADTMFANNPSYAGGLYTSFMSEAERLNAIIASGNYTQADVTSLNDAVSSASKYGQSYFNSKTFANPYEANFQKAVSANRMLAIQENITPKRDYIAEQLDELKGLRADNASQSEQLLTVQQNLLAVQEQIALLQANG